MRSHVSDFLFARPSFVEGAARILDFGNTLQEYNGSETEAEADTRAIQADVCSIAADFWQAIRAYDPNRTTNG